MAIASTTHGSYELDNFRDLLDPVIKEAEEKATQTLKAEVSRQIRDDQAEMFMRRYQLPLAYGCKGAVLTIGDLCDSFVHEKTAQFILPSSVRSILLGRDGLIRKSGGGRSNYLLQDIQIGFINDISANAEPIGPIVISGRNRLLAIQAFLSICSPGVNLRSIQIRCMAYTFNARPSLEDAIVAANSGRDFPRSESREKLAARAGIDLSSKTSIRETLAAYRAQPPAGTVVGTWLKLTASEQRLNTMTVAQISDAGASLINALAKTVKPSGGSLGRWFKEDTLRLISLCEKLEPHLEAGIKGAVSETAGGALSKKLANRLLPTALKSLEV